MRGLAHAAQDIGELVHLSASLGDAAALEKHQKAHQIRLGETLAVAGAVSHGINLVSEPLALLGIFWPPCRPEAARKREAQRDLIVQRAGDIYRLLAQRVAFVAFRRVAPQRAGQTRQKPRTQHVVCGAQPFERIAEERNQVRVVSCPRPLVATAITQGGSSEHRARPDLTCQIGGVAEAQTGAVEVSGACVGVA